MDYGRALEANGNTAQAEAALRQAIKLAPAYGYPRWYLGNFLLRSGRTDEAFAELRLAAESTQPLRAQIFSLALQVMGDDSGGLMRSMAGSPEMRAQLTSYLTANQKLDDAIRLWNSFNPAEKKEQREVCEALVKTLATVKRFHDALTVAGDLAPDDQDRPMPNQVFNGGFETASNASSAGVFGWQITSLPQAHASIDSDQHHGGGRSLRLVFKSATTLDLNSVAQLVVVEPQTRYLLEWYARTEDLRSAGTPLFHVIDETDGAVLATSSAISPGTTNWQPISLEFGTKANTEGVRLRISRASCGDDPICPIFGTVWYDDFNLQRAGRVAAAKPGNDTAAH
jgi:tetratricopeptide (TPR) repeat protein